MDIAELIEVNVYILGDVYQAVTTACFINPNVENNNFAPVIEVEQLIEKYARKLQFDERIHQVTSDACKIVKRMDRDWMVTGRHPAGICGAALLLAARMNSLRRTVREVRALSRLLCRINLQPYTSG